MDTLSVLQRLGSGRLLDELHEALKATAAEVVATGKPGVVALTLKVSTKSKGDVMIVIDEAIKRTSPVKDPRGAMFYAVYDDLWREDPRQEPMPFRTVDTESGEIREVQPREKMERIV